MLYQIFSISDMAAEIESNPRGHMRQPRTLGLAIVPGDHVVSIAIAKGFVTESPRAPPDPESPRTATDPSPPVMRLSAYNTCKCYRMSIPHAYTPHTYVTKSLSSFWQCLSTQSRKQGCWERPIYHNKFMIMNCENERMTVSSLIANLTWSCAQPCLNSVLQSSIICKCPVSCLKLLFSLSAVAEVVSKRKVGDKWEFYMHFVNC